MGAKNHRTTGSRCKFYEGLIRDLTGYAEWQFYWGGKQGDGASTEQHVEVATKSAFAASVITDQTFDDSPEEKYCPYEVEYIWDWFIQLDETREIGMTLNPITHREITAWAEGEQLNLLPFERRAIRAIDRAYIQYQNSKAKDKNDDSNR